MRFRYSTYSNGQVFVSIIIFEELLVCPYFIPLKVSLVSTDWPCHCKYCPNKINMFNLICQEQIVIGIVIADSSTKLKIDKKWSEAIIS